MASTIIQLSNLITDNTAILTKLCEQNNIPFPSLGDPKFDPNSEAFRSIPGAANACNIIIAAAAQLSTIVDSPQDSFHKLAFAHYRSAAMRVCLESNVSEILDQAGPKGMHVDDIAAKAGIEASKLARIMRLLATQHLYREITPDVFANTRLSGAMSTGKTIEEIVADPEAKHDGTPGYVAMAEHFLTDGHKITANILENLQDPKTAYSDEPDAAVFYRAFPNVKIPIWDFYELPEQSYRRRRFGVAMHGLGALQPPDLILKAFDWRSLPQDAIVVDVGGGIGTSALTLARTHPHLKIIVQDIPNVIEEGRKVWSREFPEAIESGRVTLQSHSFFDPQPVEGASVFILKQVLHDWSDSYSKKIVNHLRKAATDKSRLLVLDNIVAYACHDPDAPADYREAPGPLLPNFGAANHMGYTIDTAMLMWHNSQERTAGQMDRLLQCCGWKIVRSQRNDPPSNFFEPVEAIPI